jgi:hypothetical protein
MKFLRWRPLEVLFTRTRFQGGRPPASRNVVQCSLGLIFVSGALMFVSTKAGLCYTSMAFRIDGDAVRSGLNRAVLLSRQLSQPFYVGKRRVGSLSARIAEWVSMVLWFSIVFVGRGIAYR